MVTVLILPLDIENVITDKGCHSHSQNGHSRRNKTAIDIWSYFLLPYS